MPELLTWLIVEPAVGDRVEDNLNPVGRAYYGFSTLLCMPNALSQEGTLALGSAQSGCQIAEDLLAGGRQVVLATSPVGRAQPGIAGGTPWNG